MKRVLILGALLFLSAPFALVQSKVTFNKKAVAMPVWVGWQTKTSFNGSTYTGWIDYNPGTSTILAVTVTDQWGNSVGWSDYDGTIYHVSGQMYASGFRINLSAPGSDYIVLHGALNM